MLLVQDLPIPTDAINALLAADVEKLVVLVVVLIGFVILVVSITGLTVIKNAGKADARADDLLKQMLTQNGQLTNAIERLQEALSDDNRNHEQVAKTLAETVKTLEAMQKAVIDHQKAVAETVALLDMDVRTMGAELGKKLDALLRDLEAATTILEKMPDEHSSMKEMLVQILALTQRIKTDELPKVEPDGTASSLTSLGGLS